MLFGHRKNMPTRGCRHGTPTPGTRPIPVFHNRHKGRPLREPRYTKSENALAR